MVCERCTYGHAVAERTTLNTLMAASPDDEKMARAWAIFSEDSELGGLVQLLAGLLHTKGLSVYDLEGHCKRKSSKSEPGSTDWIVNWWHETTCLLQQPGVFDSVSFLTKIYAFKIYGCAACAYA